MSRFAAFLVLACLAGFALGNGEDGFVPPLPPAPVPPAAQGGVIEDGFVPPLPPAPVPPAAQGGVFEDGYVPPLPPAPVPPAIG